VLELVAAVAAVAVDLEVLRVLLDIEVEVMEEMAQRLL